MFTKIVLKFASQVVARLSPPENLLTKSGAISIASPRVTGIGSVRPTPDDCLIHEEMAAAVEQLNRSAMHFLTAELQSAKGKSI